MRKCKNCGELVADNVSFCPECGSMEFEGYDDINDEIVEDNAVSENVYEEKQKSFQDELNSENYSDFFQNQSVSNKLKLILLNENENELKSWTLGKLPSYTLGRISSKGSVDIDFTDFENGQYVSRRHGKIYKKNNKWYYSDLGSKHGSELISNAKRENLVPMEEYELNNGNILILAKKIKLEIQVI